MKVIIAGDYDKAGFEFNENLQEQLKSVAKKVVVLDWVTKSKKEGFSLFDKFDLSDYFAWKYSKTVNTQVKCLNQFYLRCTHISLMTIRILIQL